MPEAKCVVCGCTGSRACVGSCAWACLDPRICDRCANGEPFVIVDDGEVAPINSVTGPGPYPNVIQVQGGSPAGAARDRDLLNQAFALGRKLGEALRPRKGGPAVRGTRPPAKKGRHA
jgi:hypothetical protein